MTRGRGGGGHRGKQTSSLHINGGRRSGYDGLFDFSHRISQRFVAADRNDKGHSAFGRVFFFFILFSSLATTRMTAAGPRRTCSNCFGPVICERGFEVKTRTYQTRRRWRLANRTEIIESDSERWPVSYIWLRFSGRRSVCRNTLTVSPYRRHAKYYITSHGFNYNQIDLHRFNVLYNVNIHLHF